MPNDETLFGVCLRHRLLWWWPGDKFHTHLVKPERELSGRDLDVIAQLQRKHRMWKLTTWSGRQ